MHIDECVTAFLTAMREAGVNIDTSGGHPKPDGKLHRADALGKHKGRNKHIWYTLFPDGIASGALGDVQTGARGTWCSKKTADMDQQEQALFKKQLEAAERQRKAERAESQAAAAKVASDIMAISDPATQSHPYLKKKGLQPTSRVYVVRESFKYTLPHDEGKQRVVLRSTLFIPAYSPDLKLVGGQMISFDGAKFFIKGTQKNGSYHPIGKAPEAYDSIIIAEGWATAARLHHITGWTSIVAFDAGNLMPVAKGMREKYPNAEIIIAADNDRTTNGNPGIRHANNAAIAVAGHVIYPQFPEGHDDKTDFDDLAQMFGAGEVKRQIKEQLPVDRA